MLDKDKYILSGLPTTAISESLTSASIDSSHLFLASTQQLSSANPDRFYDSGTTVYQNQYDSTKISYQSLSSELFERFKQVFNIKSMAFEESAYYSPIEHVHDYSQVELTSNVQKFDSEGNQNQRIGAIDVNGKTTVFYMEKPIVQFKQPSPSIGQLKFLAIDTLYPINEKSDSFDGWTWPDGRRIINKNSRFADAAEHFDGNRQVSSFYLPNLCNLFRPPTSQEKNETNIPQLVGRRDVLLKHTHKVNPITPDASETINFKFAYHASKTAKEGSSCHTATTPSNITFDHELKFRINELSIGHGYPESNIPELTGKTMPTHTFLPVMIYIGKPKLTI